LNLVMADVPSHSSAWVRGVVHLFASQGVDSGWLLREAGIDPERLKHSHDRFRLADVNRMWALAVEKTGQATLGLDRSLARRHIHFNLAEQAMWSSPDLLSGLTVLSQYLHLIDDASTFSLVPERSDRWLVLQHGIDDGSPRQRVEFAMFATLLLCQRVTKRELRPLVAEFVFPEPADYHPYRMAFHCPLRFGQTANRMRLAKDDLQLPVIGEGESLFAIQDHVIENRLARSGRGLTAYRASEEMIRNLHLGEPKRDDLARRLGLTAEVFDKRIRSESNTTFEQLLDGVRRELAEQYLRQPGYTPAQVANLLGWETAAQLTAACKRWFGQTIAETKNSGMGELDSAPDQLAGRK
jgi:AraC-like DNA-binding protein